jgi:hypothetical protein
MARSEKLPTGAAVARLAKGSPDPIAYATATSEGAVIRGKQMIIVDELEESPAGWKEAYGGTCRGCTVWDSEVRE